MTSLAAPLLAAENAPIVLTEFKDVSTWVAESAFDAPEAGFYRFVVDGSRAKGRPTKIAVNLDGELLYFADQSGKDRTCDADGRLVENVYLTRGGHAVEIRGFQPWYCWDSVGTMLAKTTLSFERITYAETPVAADADYFHAQWRRANTGTQNPYVILDGVKGRGRYVGTFLAWRQLCTGWFGEGEIKFFMEGDKEFPTICGTGTEDYFEFSYGFPGGPRTNLHTGVVLPTGDTNKPPVDWSLYRWHVLDPINFQKDLKVTIQALGWKDGRYDKKADDVTSVAYWYQAEPHAAFPKLPPVDERTR